MKRMTQALGLFEDKLLNTSKLKPERLEALQKSFNNLVKDDKEGFNFRIEFKNSELIGANAFALPSGRVIMTDQLVELSKNDRELIGIMMHEIAHAKKRHGLRNIFQSTGVFFIVAALVGDVASVTSSAATFPALLVQLSYSREFEREADQVAAEYMLKQYGTTEDYWKILERLMREEIKTEDPVLPLFSTHPNPKKRIEYLKGVGG